MSRGIFAGLMLSLRLLALLAGLSSLTTCSKHPATAQPAANQGSAAQVAPVAEPPSTGHTCEGAKTCQACIETSCQWDIEKQSCATACAADAKNCLLVGATNIGAARAAEVCAGAKQ